MSIQWTIIASFLYTEIVVVLLLVLPIASPTRWQKIFRSRFLQSLQRQASVTFYMVFVVLVLFLLDSFREMHKYQGDKDYGTDRHGHLEAEMHGNMRMFRAQRNFYICGFTLFLSLVIRRLVILISTQAMLLAQNEAVMRQAQSATTTARSLLFQKTLGESAENDSNEAHDKAVSELKQQIKELQEQNEELNHKLAKEKKDKEAIKSQAESVGKEYDRLNAEHSILLQSSGDKKSD